MPALDQTVAVMLLGGLSGQSSYTSTTAPLKMRLTVTVPTATVAGTELSGPGYTAGGSAVTFGAPTGTPSGALMLNSSSLTWTNSGGVNWTLYGLEIWDSTGTPRRLTWGAWDDAPLVIGPATPFNVGVAAVGWAFP